MVWLIENQEEALHYLDVLPDKAFSKNNRKRDEQILRAYIAGQQNNKEIACDFALSETRIPQIVMRFRRVMYWHQITKGSSYG